MEFNFDNYSRHVGSRGDYEWFEWKVFMDEPDEKLRKVRSVEYRLHKTFPNPIRVVEDRDSKFALESSGWGSFWIYITIYLENDTEEYTEYYLDLRKPWPPEPVGGN
jgi:transcription initiation factor IIF auxiliary subunit